METSLHSSSRNTPSNTSLHSETQQNNQSTPIPSSENKNRETPIKTPPQSQEQRRISELEALLHDKEVTIAVLLEENFVLLSKVEKLQRVARTPTPPQPTIIIPTEQVCQVARETIVPDITAVIQASQKSVLEAIRKLEKPPPGPCQQCALYRAEVEELQRNEKRLQAKLIELGQRGTPQRPPSANFSNANVGSPWTPQNSPPVTQHQHRERAGSAPLGRADSDTIRMTVSLEPNRNGEILLTPRTAR